MTDYAYEKLWCAAVHGLATSAEPLATRLVRALVALTLSERDIRIPDPELAVRFRVLLDRAYPHGRAESVEATLRRFATLSDAELESIANEVFSIATEVLARHAQYQVV